MISTRPLHKCWSSPQKIWTYIGRSPVTWHKATAGALNKEWARSSFFHSWLCIMVVPLFYCICIIKRAGDGMETLFPFMGHPHHVDSSSRDGLWLLSVSLKIVPHGPQFYGRRDPCASYSLPKVLCHCHMDVPLTIWMWLRCPRVSGLISQVNLKWAFPAPQHFLIENNGMHLRRNWLLFGTLRIQWVTTVNWRMVDTNVPGTRSYLYQKAKLTIRRILTRKEIQ